MHPFFVGGNMKYLRIGYIANTHGLAGDLKIKPVTDEIETRFAKKQHFFIQYNNEMIEVEIVKSNYQKGLVFLKLKGYNHINDVEKFKGCECLIDVDSIEECDDDEAYYFELIDSKVYNEEHKYLGVVSEILETSANAVLRVVNENKMFLVPYVDAFIIDFKRDSKEIIIRSMEGLYEN